MRTVILNITYGDKPYYSGRDFMPVAAGCQRDGLYTDTQGDTIAERNDRYGELTAVYWAWRNLKDVDIIGTSHYRRYLMPCSWLVKTHYEISWSRFQCIDYSTDIFERDLRSYDIVFAKRWHFEGTTIERQFLAHHPFPDVLSTTRDVLMHHHPEAVWAWDKYMAGDSGYYCCLFVARWAQFDAMCQWMFPMLFDLERQLDFTRFDTYQRRMVAFLYERLLNVYLYARHLRVREYPFYFIVDDRPKSIWRQGLGARAWNVLRRLHHD